jgi:hypothetical protein
MCILFISTVSIVMSGTVIEQQLKELQNEMKEVAAKIETGNNLHDNSNSSINITNNIRKLESINQSTSQSKKTNNNQLNRNSWTRPNQISLLRYINYNNNIAVNTNYILFPIVVSFVLAFLFSDLCYVLPLVEPLYFLVL